MLADNCVTLTVLNRFYSFGKEVTFLSQIAAIAIIFITKNILFTTLSVFGHFH